MAKFIGIEACVLDAYGTLLDVHSAVGKHRARLGDKADAVSGMWRTKQLEYTWQRTILGRYVDFWRVTADGLDYALDANGVDDAALRDDLLHAYLNLDCYPEVHEVLSALRDAGLQTAILSNGSPMMLDAAVENAGIGNLLDAVLSVDEPLPPRRGLSAPAQMPPGVPPVGREIRTDFAIRAAHRHTPLMRVRPAVRDIMNRLCRTAGKPCSSSAWRTRQTQSRSKRSARSGDSEPLP